MSLFAKLPSRKGLLLKDLFPDYNYLVIFAGHLIQRFSRDSHRRWFKANNDFFGSTRRLQELAAIGALKRENSVLTSIFLNRHVRASS